MNADSFDASSPDEGSADSNRYVDRPGVLVLCTTCRQPLVRQGDQGACVYCLVNFASDASDDVLEAEPDSGQTNGSGTRHYGHFEILNHADGSPVELGRGAMGITYRAQDTVLHRAVALKVINRRGAEHPAARMRFLREARAAAQFQHPSVASVSHYGEHDGECFYAMELVVGETLEERIRREGPMPLALALEVTEQVAEALAAAEARGIIHRDLKPGNIMLAAAGEHRSDNTPLKVKVIDFGLAKAVVTGTEAPGLADTRDGFVGTPAFASPEQFARKPDERIDTRSDIFSLGVTLWYLLCGKLPFVGRTLTEIHEQQTRQALPLDQLKAAKVPAPVVSLLRSMLAAVPAARPQTARELLESCHRCQAQLSPAHRTGRRRFAVWVGAGGVLCVVAAVTLAALWRRSDPTSTFPAPSVAVLPFENLSPNPADAFFTKGVQDAITSDLARIVRLKVIGSESVKSYVVGKPRDPVAIGRELGVADLVEGTVRRDNGRVHIALRLLTPRDPGQPWAAEYDRPLGEEFALLSEIARTLAERLHASPSAAEIAEIERRPTHDPVAYDLYLRAREGPTIFQYIAQLREKARRQIGLLNDALARDPGFVLAYCLLAKAHDDLASRLDNVSAEERAEDHRTPAENALAQARRLQPDAGEVHLAIAWHDYAVLHDLDGARAESDLARRTLPNDVALELVSGNVALRQGRWGNAVRALEKMVDLDPRNLGSHAHLEMAYESLRHYDGADREMAMLQSLLPPAAVAALPAGRALLKLEGQADVAPLRAALADITDAQDPGHDMRVTFGLVVALFSHDESQVRYVTAAANGELLNIGGFPYPKAWFMGLAARMRGDDPAARTAFSAARVEVEKTIVATPQDERALLLLAMIDAGLGRKEDAVREAQRACAMPTMESDRATGPSDRCWLAMVYAWTDQPDLAIGELSKLVTGPAGANVPNQPTYGDLKLNPMWDPLRGDKRFAALAERLAPEAAGASLGK